jgi:hypothetical protein
LLPDIPVLDRREFIMLRLALCSLLVAAALVPASAQMQNNMPPAGTGGMGVNTGTSWSTGVYLGPSTGWHRPIYYRARQARPDQVRIGTPVHSVDGGLIGRVAYVNAQVAVVKSAHWAMRMPLKAFGVQDDALLLKLSPNGFDHLARAHGSHTS